MTRHPQGQATGSRATASAAPPAAARAIIELARQRATTIMEEARAVAAAECAAARQDGFAQGLEEGRMAGRTEVAEELQRVVTVLRSQVAADIESWAAEVAPGLVHLALEIAETVIRDASDQDRRKAVTMATEALRALGDDGRRRVRCNPADVAAVAAALGVGLADVEVVDEATIESPGCVVEGENGLVDATIPTQMERVRSRLVAG